MAKNLDQRDPSTPTSDRLSCPCLIEDILQDNFILAWFESLFWGFPRCKNL